MFELRPYRNNNHMTTYDPFRDMEALERAFFALSAATATSSATSARSRPTFRTRATITCSRPICPA
mgnify:CR=1 FL=1